MQPILEHYLTWFRPLPIRALGFFDVFECFLFAQGAREIALFVFDFWIGAALSKKFDDFGLVSIACNVKWILAV